MLFSFFIYSFFTISLYLSMTLHFIFSLIFLFIVLVSVLVYHLTLFSIDFFMWFLRQNFYGLLVAFYLNAILRYDGFFFTTTKSQFFFIFLSGLAGCRGCTVIRHCLFVLFAFCNISFHTQLGIFGCKFCTYLLHFGKSGFSFFSLTHFSILCCIFWMLDLGGETYRGFFVLSKYF